MNLVRLLYVSRLSEDCDRKALEKILETSRRKNEQKGVTGALCYDPDFFLQCLEGSRVEVNELYKLIIQDKRHTKVTLLEYCQIDKRMFDGWNLAYVSNSDVDKSLLFKYNHTREFDPFSMNANQALGFLYDISRDRSEFLREEITRRGKKSAP
ncbi:BLUF domain-containing protein [Candidatus Sumerlaeota bacterium]|nr:BLUF domain-containing protein [Candidatus Sumerlaeota bacterium]